jgi:sugar phosphate isomerase/epimerase
MLLTLSARSLEPLITKGELSLVDLPQFAREKLDLNGLTLQASLLSGWGIPDIDRLRDQADKVGCPCLTLIEEQPHPLNHPNDDTVEASIDRMERVIRVAHRLGCSGVAMGIKDVGAKGDNELVPDRLKEVVLRAERMELNLLISPQPGLTATPSDLTELIRNVGGFRIGSFPDFEAAAASGDAPAYLRALTPYASAVTAAATKFNTNGEHEPFDIRACMLAVKSVGYEGTVSLEYRGSGDVLAALEATRDLVRAALEAEE